MSSEEPWRFPPWENIKWGSAAIGIAVLMFLLISWTENSGGGTMRVHWLVALSYYVGGKWTVAGVLGGVGCFLVGLGLYDLFRRDE